MKVLSKKDFLADKENYLKLILKGAVFIYPTDTIYGIGCNAEDSGAVRRIRELKKRPTNPFSVIAPSKKWISDNCILGKEAKKWLKKLPGPYTLILKIKKDRKKCVAKEVNAGSELIGVRIPKNWFSNIVKQANVPVVTTSVNEAGKQFMVSEKDVNQDIAEGVDFIVYEGEKAGKPSTIINLSQGKPIIMNR
ncbi:MAG: L-threonylcarbamoyladenylate synthase [Candidatus Woesearchaeota archaeon]|nr:L-threonylcarbamoyladenylate synthase [Candidatus Woesearchaeota archaeon]